MKRRFAILTAALALLTFLAVPMGMWGQTTVTQTNFTSYYGNLNDNTQVTFQGYKGGGTSTPYATAGTIRLYQNSSGETGGYIVIGVPETYSITSATIQSTMATTTGYLLTSSTPGNTTPAKSTFNVSDYALAANTDYTVSGISSQFITFACFGTTSSTRLYVSKISITYESSGGQTYTVTYHANVTGIADIEVEYGEGSDVTVAANTFSNPGYTFTEWNTEVDGSGDSYAPGDEIEDIDDNIDLYAQWEESNEVTGTLTATNLELTGSYTSNTEKTVDGITYVYSDLMKSSNNIQAKASSGTIKNTTAYPGDIISVVITHSGTARATTINGSADGTNWTQVATGSGSITADFSGKGYKYFQITRGSNAAYWEKIDITYSTSSSSLTDSDLAITNASTALSFDLYNNSTAQTITYTTSSTGAITITPASPTEYFSYVHDATAKTITVTPMAVTPSAQTVTISQEADDDYYAGTATFTVSVANSDPNVPGTVNNPYTVAQAIANTPSNGNVYIQGIVSSFFNTSIVGDGTNYRYYISDDGTTTTQLLVYKGKGLNQTTFTNADDLLVGDEVVIYGTLITYQSAPEVASGNYLYSWNRPAAAVEAPTFSLAAGTYTSAQNVTLSCATAGATIYYTLDGTEPTSACMQYTAALTISSTTTVKAIAYVGTDASTVATATYHFCSAEDPYTVTEALAFNEYPANGIYVHGIVSTAPTSLSSGTLTYFISVDGEATNELEVYKGKDLENANFTAVDDIQVGDIVTIYGNVVIYNGAKEFSSGNYLVSFERPAQQYTLTVTCSENVEIFTFVGESTDPGVEGSTTLQVTNGTEVGLSVSVSEGYVLTLMVDGENVTSDLDDTGYYTFSMPAHAVTVTATASVAPVVTTNTYTLATSIESGKQYIIVGWANGTPYAMGYDKGNNRHAVEISVTGDDNETASATIANTETNAHEFTITSLGEGYYSIMDATNSGGYLYAAATGSNHLKTETTLDENHNGDWKITITDGSFSVVADQSSNRNVMQFNNSSNLFACYASASQHPVFFYVKDETPVTETIELPITGYGTGTGNWYLIATPIGDVAPTNVANMLSNSYDLYYFDQEGDDDGNEWINYKGDATHPGMGGFGLEIGKGYLYANSNDVDLIFTGRCPVTESTYPVTLKKTNGVRFAGWNLVGNPYADIAYFADNRDFYTMNSTATAFELIGAEDARHIEAAEGVFVTAEVNNEEVVFTTTAPAKTGNRLALNLSQGNNVIDRAFIRFGECRQLPKLQFNRNSTKLYIPMDDEDYAVVRAEEMGEMPVNFKAESNGNYSLNFGMDNVEFAYLHLIDNLTGNEVDLLQTPSYSFEASTTDYASRFKLVFATGNNSNDDNFAYFSNGSFVINNEGIATLQVIDVTGRIVKCESINGCTNVNVNAAPGVYMLRLVNGTDLKVQKVVVK